MRLCRPRFRDLVDLLLGWALEPALPDAARHVAVALLGDAVRLRGHWLLLGHSHAGSKLGRMCVLQA